RGVALPEQFEQLPNDIACAFPRAGGERPGELPDMVGAEAEERIDLDATDRLRSLAGEGLDVHAPFCGHHREVSARAPIQHDGCVELLRDREQLLREDAVDHVPHEAAADHPLGCCCGGLRRSAELHATTLAATADLHLDLDDR